MGMLEAIYLSVLIHTGLLTYFSDPGASKAGAVVQKVSSCADSTKSASNCTTDITVQLTPRYTDPTPTPAVSTTQPVSSPYSVKAAYYQAVGSRPSPPSVVASSKADFLDKLTTALESPTAVSSVRSAPWFSKLDAVDVVKFTVVGYESVSDEVLATVGAATGTYLISYQATAPFILEIPQTFFTNYPYNIATQYQNAATLCTRGGGYCQKYSVSAGTVISAAGPTTDGVKMFYALRGASFADSSVDYGSAGAPSFPTDVTNTLPICPAGHSYTPGSKVCTATSPANALQAADSKCFVQQTGGGFATDSTDPDCNAAKTAGKLATGSSATVSDFSPSSPLTKESQTVTPTATGGATLVACSDLTYLNRKDCSTATITETGTASTISQSTPTNSAGTGAPGSSTTIVTPSPGTGAVQCGGAGQTPCAVADGATGAALATLAGLLGDIKAGQCGGPSQPPCAVSSSASDSGSCFEPPCAPEGPASDSVAGSGPDATDSAQIASNAVSSNTFIDRIVSFRFLHIPQEPIPCETTFDAVYAIHAPLTSGTSIDTPDIPENFFCSFITPFEDGIKLASQACAWMGAIMLFIHLRAAK